MLLYPVPPISKVRDIINVTCADPDLMLSTAIDCYLSAILRIAECLEQIQPELAAPHKDQLMRLRKRLAFETNIESLLESRDALKAELASFCEQTRLHAAENVPAI